jgi:hypothetical protein
VAQDGLRRQLDGGGRSDNARDMIAMLVRHDNQPGAANSALNLCGSRCVIRLLDPAAEKFVDLQVHAGVHHHIGIGVDHLERRACLHARSCGGVFDREVLRAAAFRELEEIDARGPRPGNQCGHTSKLGYVGCPCDAILCEPAGS